MAEGENLMSVMEILKGRRERYEMDLQKSFSEEVKRETEARIKELDNLMFIISTQMITEIQ